MGLKESERIVELVEEIDDWTVSSMLRDPS